jgi:diaminohydroxyphosphoribosylaminopyrimidine deaminase/5-amino-6-(5-phosphoribosylamino)uracil reductase
MRGSQDTDVARMRQALSLARRAMGETSPNPMVGALLVKDGQILGRGWHHRAGQPHAEIEAFRDCERRGFSPKGATLYVTLEPCCTHGRTPPCTDAILSSGVRCVVVGATDPNPHHAGRAFEILRKAGIEVRSGVLAEAATQLNDAFNQWIVHRTPWITVKAAMTLDGKIADQNGHSKWITSPASRTWAMKLRRAADAILVGVNTVIADDPSLTVRKDSTKASGEIGRTRIVLDPRARTPLTSKLLNDAFANRTHLIVTKAAPARRIASLRQKVSVTIAPTTEEGIDISWLLSHLGAQGITHLLVEGGGETNAAFLSGGHAHQVAFFYAPKVIGGRTALRGVAGKSTQAREDLLRLGNVQVHRIGGDLLYQARILPALSNPTSQPPSSCSQESLKKPASSPKSRRKKTPSA